MSETTIFDHYKVSTRDDGSLFELGRGAMGITYKAYDTSLRIPVALKVINATYLNSDIARQRFVREARSAAQLRHRNVASVFHLGTEGDNWFYAMEFIDGETLDALIKRQGPLNPVMALNITGQVARALNAAAQHGLVHRDIKPANLMLVHEDDELVAKVIDFGLAKASVTGDGEDAATLSLGGFVGTPHFASPEQLEEKEIDSRSDIYSLGVTLWYMLAGQAPFAGSMAQVMSQHLSKPPPFEKLENLPVCVSDVMRKMLAKDPADRFQTPAELRKAIEAALEKIGSSGISGSATVAAIEPQEDFATLLDGSALIPSVSSFETNTTIANRYRVAQSCGESNAGRVFRAFDTQRKMEVRLIVLHPEALADTIALTALEREVEKLVPVKHPNLLGVFGFETVDRGSFLVLEWAEGFSLLDLLKARRELGADEALKILQQAAEGADAALGLGLNGLEFGLHQVHIHFPGPIEKEKILRAALDTWPAFQVKLYPVGATRNIMAGQTWAGAQTVVGGTEGVAAPGVDMRPQYVQALAAVTYELLGGTLSPVALRASGPGARYTPLSTLSEESNEVLRRALDCGRSYPSAREFSTALGALGGQPVRRHDAKISPVVVKPDPVTKPTSQPGPQAVPGTRPPQRKGAPMVLMGSIAAVLVAIAGATVFFHPWNKDTTAEVTAPETHVTPGDQPPTTSDSTGPTTTGTDTPPPAPPAPSTPAPATPPSGPSRQELLKSAVNVAQDLEEKGNWSKSLDAWLAVAKDYPESPVGKNHLETFLNHLRDRPAPISFEEFQNMREQITESAQLGILSAMLLLGDNLRKPEPKTAFQWFASAAEKNDATGLVQYGQMLKKGEGVDAPDPVKAAVAFKAASDQGDVAGQYELGECYLYGRGVPTDEKHAVELLRGAGDAGNTKAMAELGFCYSHALGVPRDFDASFQMYSKAAEKGNLEAGGNLGVLYMNGQGTSPNPKKAADLFEKGAKAGDPFCMALYAQCLEVGKGVPRNSMMASGWFRKAAALGNKNAIDWCDQNSVPYSPGK
jgi:TPR repeat protein/serine/threonine protein kinase